MVGLGGGFYATTSSDPITDAEPIAALTTPNCSTPDEYNIPNDNATFALTSNTQYTDELPYTDNEPAKPHFKKIK